MKHENQFKDVFILKEYIYIPYFYAPKRVYELKLIIMELTVYQTLNEVKNGR